jgi:hypothetical protein
VVENPVYVGALSAIALSVGSKVNKAQLDERAERLGQLSETTTANLLTDARAGELLSLLGSYYFARNNYFDEIAAQTSGVDRTRLLSGGIVSSATGVRYLAGFPISARFTGVQIDVDEDVQAVVSKTGDDRVSDAYMRSAGMNASSSEGAIFADTLGGEGVSTADVMRDATERGAAILVIDKANVGRLDELTDVSADVRREIARAVNERDAAVIVPDSESTIGGWTGTGYVIDEGSSVSYRISGGLNGGAVAATLASILDGLNKLVENGGKNLKEAFNLFEDCNAVRIGTFAGTSIVAGVLTAITASHLAAPMALLPSLTIPFGLIGGVGFAFWAAILVAAVFLTIVAIEACFDSDIPGEETGG